MGPRGVFFSVALPTSVWSASASCRSSGTSRLRSMGARIGVAACCSPRTFSMGMAVMIRPPSTQPRTWIPTTRTIHLWKRSDH